jgi:ribonuclease D
MSDPAADRHGVPEPSVTPLFLEPSTPPAEVPADSGPRAQVSRRDVPDAALPVADSAAPLAPLLVLRDGVPGVVEDGDALAAAAAQLAAGHGPVAVDAERASSYRYGHRAYLVQLRRGGTGSLLIDPIGCPDLSSIGAAIGDAEWIVHAANQDLPCLAEVGMVPSVLFDTELAGRLAGYPRVGLATMVETLLGRRMEKSHSAADWSRRPLPEPWLRYAALDVEVLLELRGLIKAELSRQGKLEWAEEEFEHVRTSALAGTAVAQAERWRRTSGIHRMRNRRQLAIVRSMWNARDRLARDADISPTRLLPDASIVHVALNPPPSAKTLAASAGFVGRGSRRHLEAWWEAICEALALPDPELPLVSRPAEGPPPAHRWAERDRLAADRLAVAKAAVAALADEHNVPVENLVQPDAVRRVCWNPPQPPVAANIADALRALGVRKWQIALVAAPLAKGLTRVAVHEVDHR